MTLVLAIAFWVNPQIVASFNYAVRLMELPQGMFGISLATYLLPTLAGLAAEKNHSEFRATLRHGIGTVTFLNLIAAVLLIVLAEPIVRLLFERGAFTAASTDRATFALVCLAPGLVAFSTVNILARAFYAVGDTQTPMKISVACLCLESHSGHRAGRAAAAGRPRHCKHCDFNLQRQSVDLHAAQKTRKVGNGIVARHIFAARHRRDAGRFAGMVRLAVLGRFTWP